MVLTCVRERSALGPRKASKKPRKLLRNRFGPYRTCEVYAVPVRRHTGRKLAVPPCRNNPQYNYPKPNRSAASPQVVGGGGDGRAFHSGPLRFKDRSF